MENVQTIELNENNCKEYTEAEFWAKIAELKAEKKEADEPIKKGDKVNLNGYVYVGRGAKKVKNVIGEVIKTTQKAICVNEITNNGWVKTWVPKAAIYNIEKNSFDIEGDLKTWFVKK